LEQVEEAMDLTRQVLAFVYRCVLDAATHPENGAGFERASHAIPLPPEGDEEHSGQLR
jgi:hypothetical protein